jgi:hypothetical protein
VRLFTPAALAVAAAAALVLGRGTLAAYARWGHAGLATPRGRDRLALGGSVLALAMLAGQWLAALAPPEGYDEIAYHLPEARTLAATHALPLTLGTDRIYGNLPGLMETLYGEALAIKGPELAHALHLSVLAGFLLLAGATVRSLWGARAGVLAVVLLLVDHNLLYNATTAYVDAAAVSFEVGAVLCVVLWLVHGERRDVAAAALLLGFALSVKYTTLATGALLAVPVAVRLVRGRELALAGRLAAVAGATAGFWYLKNLVRFGNPVYPLYLGHEGIPADTYRYFLGRVEQFGPRTARGFVRVPWRFAQLADLPSFLALQLAPLALLVRRARTASALLLGYAVAYALYWYWFGSHQVRFLEPAVVVALLLVAVAVAAGGARTRIALVLLAVAAVGLAQARTHGFSASQAPAVVRSWFGDPKARFALGLDSRATYFRRYFGCEVDALRFLDARGERGAVGVLVGDRGGYYTDRFVPLASTARTPAAAARELRAAEIRFLLARGGARPAALSTNPPLRTVLAHEARPLWQSDDCALFRLSAPRG